MEDIDPGFSRGVRKGDIIVAGRNFGCGSSREQAAAVLKEKGVGAVIASSISRIFYRNSINIGLPAIICREAYELLTAGDEVSVDLERGRIVRLSDGLIIQFRPLPSHLMDILKSGGLIEYTKKRLHLDR